MSAVLDISAALKDPGQDYPFTADAELPEMQVLGDPVAFTDIRAEGYYFSTGDKVSFKGDVTAQVRSRCARCLEPVTESISAPIDAVYARESDPDDPDLYLFEAYKVDLTDAVKDALLLELPMRFLCSEDCKGLCPVCGANRNKGICSCQEEVIDSPFAALKTFVQQAQENEEV